MKKISPKTFLMIAPVLIFLVASIIWFLILAQAINFITGFIILSLISFLAFWKGLLVSWRAGELIGLKNRKQIFIISLGVALGFSELVWTISFLPFSFFILSGLFTTIFAFVFNIFKEYFKQYQESSIDLKRDYFKKLLAKNIILGIVLIIILVSISSWLPPKTF